MIEILGSVAAPVTDPASRTFAPTLLSGLVVAAVVVWRQGGGVRDWLAPHLWAAPSARMDVALVLARQLLAATRLIPEVGGGLALALGLVSLLDRTVGAPDLHAPSWAILLGYTLTTFVVSDLSRWIVHRALHASDVLWQFHQVHHSAEVLTPLTFHRVHPVEEAVYALRGALVAGGLGGLAYWAFRGAAVEWTILGVNGLGIAFNAASGNLRHSHVWLRFGDRVERWLLSPAQHQLHHGREAAEHLTNYGTWLAVWDRLAGTLRLAPERPVPVGLHARDRNHAPDDLPGALLSPFRGVARLGVAGLLSLGRVARAQEAEEPAYEVIVEAEDGIPRVAGSAYVIGQDELERYEYDDIHRVVARVPGVYVRGEDGFGLRPNIGMRGGNSDRSAKIVLLEDGILLSPAPYAAPAAYYFPMATRMVGVEVFKGPAAIKHGPQTIGGAINLLTRQVPVEPAGEMDVGLGGYDTFKAHAWGGTGGRRAGILVESSNLTSGGFKVLDGGGPTGFSRRDLLVKSRFDLGAHRLELKAGYGSERSFETYLGLSATDFADDPYRRYAASALDEMNWHRVGDSLGWTWRPSPAIELRTVAYHHSLYRVWTKFNRFAGDLDVHDLLQTEPGGQSAVYLAILRGEEDSLTPDQTLQIGTNDRTFHNGGVQSVLRVTSGGERVNNHLEVGARAHVDAVRRLHTEDPFAMTGGTLVATGDDTLVLLDSVTEARALAGYVHDDLALGRLHLVPGFRYELIRTAAGTPETGPVDPVLSGIPLPGGAVLVRPVDWLDAFAGVHRGFSPVAPGSPAETEPETAWNYELGLRAAPGETHAEAVGFYSDYANVTGQCTLSGGCDPTRVDQQFNGGRAAVFGVESLFAHTVHLPGEVSVAPELSYTWTETRFLTGFISEFPQFGTVEAGDAMPYVPVHQGAARLTVLGSRWSVGLGANARGAMRDVAGQGEIPEQTEIPAALLFDAAAEADLGRGVRLYATGTNLANATVLESWRPFGARPAAPFQAMIGVKGALQPR
jgi:Fe(3+) dicitrate transport protein